MMNQLKNHTPYKYTNPVLSDDDFFRIRDLVQNVSGIDLSPKKKHMLSGRLCRRIRHLNMQSYSDYADYLLSASGEEEVVSMIDEVSTNKTHFFREQKHFDFLEGHLLAEYCKVLWARADRTLRVWSAGCSTGEEPYTIAMVLENFFKNVQGLSYSVLATDISTKVLKTAKYGIYPEECLEDIPINFQRQFLLRGVGKSKGHYKITPDVRKNVHFKRLNFMSSVYDLASKVDIIFFRNVAIYFDPRTTASIYHKFYQQMQPGGYLFIGHSEILRGGIKDKVEKPVKGLPVFKVLK